MLERDGWLFWPEDPNRVYRLWFLRPTPRRARTICRSCSMTIRSCTSCCCSATRCAMTRPAAAQYAALKDQLAEQHQTDRDAYTDAKSDFVRSVVQAAGAAPASRRGALPPTR